MVECREKAAMLVYGTWSVLCTGDERGSAEAVEISADLTVADVIQRVSGYHCGKDNTGDGQYALLRGMVKRFNYTLVKRIITNPITKNRFTAGYFSCRDAGKTG